MVANDYFEGRLNQERYWLALQQAGYFPTL
jgi:hypothetical protein